MSSQSSQPSQQSDCSSSILLHTVSEIVQRLRSPSENDDENLELSLASTLSALKSLNILKKLDKSTESEARQFISKALKKGNSGVQKVVDYTRQQLGFNMLSTESTHERCCETPKKRIQKTPVTAPHLSRTEPNLEQMATLMKLLGMEDSNANTEETELVQNDSLWMQEIMTMLMRCLRRQIVLESRQKESGQNSWYQHPTAARENISAMMSPEQGNEISLRNAAVHADQLEHQYDQTYLNAADETAMQQATQCQLSFNESNNQAINKLEDVQGRRTTDFKNKGKEICKVDTKMMKPNPEYQNQANVFHQQSMTSDNQGTRLPMMTRAEIYAALSEKTDSHGSRINPVKGKFFFGSSLRLYGGSRWSELRKRAHDGIDENTHAIESEEFELKEDDEKEFKRARTQEITFEENNKTLADKEFDDLIAVEETLHNQITEIKGYQGNWKASQPAFIVITNSLFTSHY